MERQADKQQPANLNLNQFYLAGNDDETGYNPLMFSLDTDRYAEYTFSFDSSDFGIMIEYGNYFADIDVVNGDGCEISISKDEIKFDGNKDAQYNISWGSYEINNSLCLYSFDISGTGSETLILNITDEGLVVCSDNMSNFTATVDIADDENIITQNVYYDDSDNAKAALLCNDMDDGSCARRC